VKGVNEIYVVAVNDVFVMKAWKESLAPEGTDVHFIADILWRSLALLALCSMRLLPSEPSSIGRW